MNNYKLSTSNSRISATAPTTPCVASKQFNLPFINSIDNDSRKQTTQQQQHQIPEEEEEHDIPSLHDLIHNSTTTLDKQATTTTSQGNENNVSSNSISDATNTPYASTTPASSKNPNITLLSFNNYLSSIHCQENLQFILELNKFLTCVHNSNSTTPTTRTTDPLTKWQQIYSKFLIAESEWEVNLPSRLSSTLHFAQLPLESTVQNCKVYIINEILQNLYHEYLKTVTRTKCGLYRRRSIAMGSLPRSLPASRKNSETIGEENNNDDDDDDDVFNKVGFNSSILSSGHVRPTVDTAIINQQCPLTPPYSPPPHLQQQQQQQQQHHQTQTQTQTQTQQSQPQTPVVSQYLSVPNSASSSNSQPHSSLTRHISLFGRNNKRRHSSNSSKVANTSTATTTADNVSTTATVNTHKHHDHHYSQNITTTTTTSSGNKPGSPHKHKPSSVMIDGYDYYSIPVADMANDNSSVVSAASTASSSLLPPTSRSRPPSICSDLVSDAVSSSSSSSTRSSNGVTDVTCPDGSFSHGELLQDTPASSRNNSSSSKSGPSSSMSGGSVYYKSHQHQHQHNQQQQQQHHHHHNTTSDLTMVTSPTTPLSANTGTSIHKIVDNSMNYFNKMKKFKFKKNSQEEQSQERDGE
ncbi:hypothetical protein KGF57_002284 [Candida theae]|uniref:RGS domain-containing protein n=1 Tax=Candida theae TaxID=1198502 RepID=A0AAD5BG13_9ASCO|nr:uncharacterized protein KGF57_002284 [Candida theae]KAI5958850.1 hypothetical protein KGF57_002284 [Candida theae]